MRQNIVPLGGGGDFLKSLIQGCFRNLWVRGGGGGMVTFLCTRQQMGPCTQNMHCRVWTTHYSELELSSSSPWNPIQADIPLLVNGNIFLQFSPMYLHAFTGTQPVLRGMAHKPSVARSTLRCLVSRTLCGEYEAFWPSCQALPGSPAPTLHPQSALSCAPKVSEVYPGKQQPVE